MVKDLAYYCSISNATGCTSSKETQTNQIIKRLERDFENPLDVDTFIRYGTLNTVNLEISSQKYSENMGYQESFKSLINVPIFNGDTFYNEKENTYWICTESKSKDYLYYSGTLTKCNWILKWQNESGNIVERPAIVLSASQYNSGENATKTITLGYNQIMVYIILDNESKILKSDKRMFIDNDATNPKAYRITRADTITKSFMGVGCMSLIFSEDTYNPQTDRIDLMLCDYITPSPTPPTPVEINITYSGQPQVRVGGTNKTFTATSENEITSWTKVCTSEQEDYVVLTPDVTNSKKCKVKCLANDLLIGSSFRLQCTDGTNTGDLLVSIVGGV